MNSLDFMIVGVQKAGTSALSHFLDQHPNLAIAQGKEVHLFDSPNYSPACNIESINYQYANFFPAGTEQKIRGEATPIYIYFPEIAAELKRYNSALKLIVIFRDPVKRALSHYVMERSRGNETLPLWLALLLEPFRLKQSNPRALSSSQRCHSYVNRGLYAQQLLNLRHYFPDEQILIIENSELMYKHEPTLAKTCAFLGINEQWQTTPEKVFSGEYPRKIPSFYYFWLRLYFRGSNRSLKAQLIAMGYSPKWSWLEQ